MNTKMSSAPIALTMKTARKFRPAKYFTVRIMRTMNQVTGRQRNGHDKRVIQRDFRRGNDRLHKIECVLIESTVRVPCVYHSTIARKTEPVTTQMYTKTKMILNIASAESWIKI